jgi:hypothetical protein
MTSSLSKTGGSACKYIKKYKHCITPCKIVHNNRNKKHKWFCKKTKRCSGKDPKHRKKHGKKLRRTKKVKKVYKKEKEPVAEKKEEQQPEQPPATTSFTAAATNTISSLSSDITNRASNLFGTKPEEEKKPE